MFLNTPDSFTLFENSEATLNKSFQINPIKDKIDLNLEKIDFKNSPKRPIKNSNHIKIPMNAFMVWAKINRKIMATQYPNFSNLEISKLLGKKWNEMTSEERTPFINEAKQLRIEHLNQYPEFRYQPRRRQKKSNKKCKTIKMETIDNNNYSPVFNNFENLNLPKFSKFNFNDINTFESKNYYDAQTGAINYNSENILFNDYFDQSINTVFQPIDNNLPSVSSLINVANPYTFNYNYEKPLLPYNCLEDVLFYN